VELGGIEPSRVPERRPRSGAVSPAQSAFSSVLERPPVTWSGRHVTPLCRPVRPSSALQRVSRRAEGGELPRGLGAAESRPNLAVRRAMRCPRSPSRRGVCQSIRAHLDDGEAIHVILDDLDHRRGNKVRQWCRDNNVELVFTPTHASWANPDICTWAATPVRARHQRPPRPSRVGPSYPEPSALA
jgi:hypothetical protein